MWVCICVCGQLRKAFAEYARDAFGLEGDEAARLVSEGSKTVGVHRRAFWLGLARRFRWRSVKSIFLRGHRLLHPDNYQGKWTDEDLAQLRRAAEEHNFQWARVGRALGRLPATCYAVYQRHMAKRSGAAAAGQWADNEMQRLADAVRAQIGGAAAAGSASSPAIVAGGGAAAASSSSSAVASSTSATSSISWPAVAEAVGTRSAEQCMRKWNDGFGATVEGRGWTPQRDAQLIEALAADGADVWQGVLRPVVVADLSEGGMDAHHACVLDSQILTGPMYECRG